MSYVTSIAIDAQGNKWFGIGWQYIAGSGGCVAKFDDEQWTVYDFTNSILPDDPINSISIDALSNKWFAASGNGVFIFNENGIITGNHQLLGEKNQLIIYPNPAKGQITISVHDLSGNTQFLIVTVSGEKVLVQQITTAQTRLDISALPPGVYFIRVWDEKAFEVAKLIKQ
jgi:hypothetical protein